MAQLSVGEAFGAGFKVIKRHPVAPLAWGLVYFLVAYVPVALLMGVMAPAIGAAVAAGRPAGLAGLSRLPMVLLLQPLQIIGSVVAMAVLNAAVFRAVLEPQNSRACFLRLGAQELWQGLVFIAMYLLSGVVAFVIIAVLAIIGGIVGFSAMAGHGAASALVLAPIIGVGVLIALVGLFWLMLRFSMALPMSFAHRDFRLFESWPMTRGHTLQLLGLGCLIALAVLVSEMLLGILGLAIGGAAVMGLLGTGVSGLPAVFSQPVGTWLPKLMVVFIPLAIVFSASIGYLFAIGIAPWADAYRQLSGHGVADVFSDGPAPAAAPAPA